MSKAKGLRILQQGRKRRATSSVAARSVNSSFRRRPLRSITTTAKSTTASPPSGATAHSSTVVATNLSDLNKAIRTCGLGFVAGNLGALTGMGGGFLMVPLLCSPRVAAMGQHYAHGTSSFAVTAAGLAGAIGYNIAKESDGTFAKESDGTFAKESDGTFAKESDGTADKKESKGLSTSANIEYAIAIATTGALSARLGASITPALSATTLKRLLGVYMLSVAPIVPLKSYIVEKYGKGGSILGKDGEEVPWHKRIVPPACIGLGGGFLMGVFGVGGGAVVVPALTVLTDLNHYEALSTSLCSMVLPSMVSSITHYQKGKLVLKIGGPLAIGAFMGAYFGSRCLALHCSEDKLRYGFAGIMALLGTRALLF